MTIGTMRNTYCHAHCPCDGRGPATSLPPSPLRASSQTSPNARQQSHTDNNFNKEDLRGKGIDVRENDLRYETALEIDRSILDHLVAQKVAPCLLTRSQKTGRKRVWRFWTVSFRKIV